MLRTVYLRLKNIKDVLVGMNLELSVGKTLKFCCFFFALLPEIYFVLKLNNL